MASNLEEIPSPPAWPFIGNVTDIDPELPFSTFMRFADQYGSIFRLKFPGGKSVVYVTDHAMVNEVCDEKRFEKNVTKSNPVLKVSVKHKYILELLSDIESNSKKKEIRNGVHDGLFTADSEEENWGIAHRILMPAFGPMSMANLYDDMHDIASQLAMKWARHGPETPILVTDDFTRLTLDTLALCAMNFRFNSYYPDEMHPFIEAMGGFLKESGKRSRRPPFSSLFYRDVDRKYQLNIDLMRQTADEVLQVRKSRGSHRKDLLQAMLEGVDSKTGKKMTDTSITDNLITFLIAGHETTSGLLSFAMYQLIKNPEKYLKLQKEIDEVCGTDSIKLEHLPKLQYTSAVLRETLRLHPTISMFTVSPIKDEILGGKYQVEAHQPIMLLVAKSQMDPAIFGDDVHEFKPERMYGENFDRLMREYPSCWKPFGNGMRGCIGRPFAWQESLLVMAMLFQNFNFISYDPDYALKLKQTLTLKPKEFYIRAVLRDGLTASIVEHRIGGTKAPPTATSSSKHDTKDKSNDSDGNLINIYYGSNTGTCEALAQRLASSAAEHGFKVGVIDVMDAAVQHLEKYVPSIFFTASYEGHPPDNAALFVKWLESLEGKELENVPFAVFGCGNHDWAQTFHRVPNLVDDKLEEVGGSRIASIGLADAAENRMFTDFEAWEDEIFWPAMALKFNVQRNEAKSIPTLDLQITTPRTTTLRQDVAEASVVTIKNLTQPGGAIKKHIEIQLPQGATYRAGDYLAVLPVNDNSNVRRVMHRFHLPLDSHVTIPSGQSHTTLPTDTSISVSDLLSAYVELEQPATRKSILALIEATSIQGTKEALQLLTGKSYDTEIVAKRTSFLDLLEKYDDIQLPFSVFLQALPPLRVRQYSISSSPLWNPSCVSLTYAVLDEPLLSNAQKRKLGVATSYLSSLQVGDKLHVAVRQSHAAFHLPADAQNTPIIMVAAGTGVAPFRGFLQERAAMAATGRKLAPALLFFGCRTPGVDDLYRDDFNAWQAAGAVDVRRAYSRVAECEGEEAKGCRYVQDRLWLDREDVLGLWKEGGRVYVCGSRVVGNSINETVVRIHKSMEERRGNVVSDEDAEDWLARIRNVRYAADVFD